MEQPILQRNLFESFKATYTVERPDSIKEKLAAWAFENAEDIDDVIGRLEAVNCAGCYSPAPIYNNDMAREVAHYWLEIDEAIDSYRDATGEAWAPQKDQTFLNYLWFAYEWHAHELASQLRCDLEADEEA